MLPPSITENCQNVRLRTTILGAGYPFDWTMFLNWSRWRFQRFFIIPRMNRFFLCPKCSDFSRFPSRSKKSFDWGWVARKNHDRGAFRITRKTPVCQGTIPIGAAWIQGLCKGRPPKDGASTWIWDTRSSFMLKFFFWVSLQTPEKKRTNGWNLQKKPLSQGQVLRSLRFTLT